MDKKGTWQWQTTQTGPIQVGLNLPWTGTDLMMIVHYGEDQNLHDEI